VTEGVPLTHALLQVFNTFYELNDDNVVNKVAIVQLLKLSIIALVAGVD
jgi:hypothetical protein